MATINRIPMTIMGNLVSGLEPKRTSCLLYTSPSPRDCS